LDFFGEPSLYVRILPICCSQLGNAKALQLFIVQPLGVVAATRKRLPGSGRLQATTYRS